MNRDAMGGNAEVDEGITLSLCAAKITVLHRRKSGEEVYSSGPHALMLFQLGLNGASRNRHYRESMRIKLL